MWLHIENPAPSVDAYLVLYMKYITAEFRFDTIWKDGA